MIALPLHMFAPRIIEFLLGDAYAAASPVLAILAWMTVPVFFGVVRRGWLYAGNALRPAMALDMAALGLIICANWVLVPRFGAVGAAYSALIAAAGPTLLLTPFSDHVRRSLSMFLIAILAPLRVVRAAWRYR